MRAQSDTHLGRGVLALLRSHGFALLGVGIVNQALVLVLVAPVSSAAWAVAVTAATGSMAVVNASIVQLAQSPSSLIVLGAAALLAIAVRQLAFGATAHVVLDGLDSLSALRSTVRQLGALLQIALWRYCLMALYSLPPVALALIVYAVRFGFRDPVAAYAREPRTLAVLGALLAVTMAGLWAYLSLRWVLASVLHVDHGYRGRAALRRSETLTSGRWFRLGAAIAALALGVAFAGAVVRVLGRGFAIEAAAEAGVAALAVLIGLNALLGIVALVAYSVAIDSLVLVAYCGVTDRAPAPIDSAGSARRRWAALAAAVIATGVAGAVGALLTLILAAEPVDPSSVEIIAHRAGEAHAPENTLAAVRQARRDRADRIEFDVQRTVDDRIVVVHDAELLRLSGEDVSVAESTLQQVQSVDIGEGERVPTLEAFLDAAGDTPLALEIKTHPKDEQTTREVVALLQRRGAVQRTVVMSLDPELTALAHRIEPTLVTADLVSVAAGEIYRLPSEVIAPSNTLLSSTLVTLAHTAGKRVWVWSVEDEGLLREAAVRGADGVIVSDVPTARRVLQSMPTVSRADIVRDRLSEVLGGSAP